MGDHLADRFCATPGECGYVDGEEVAQKFAQNIIFFSLGLSAVSAFTSLTITEQLKYCHSPRWYYIFITAAGLGVGVNTVWSMHFVGMQALTLDGGMVSGAKGPLRIRFELSLTFLSALAAWAIATMGLHIIAGRRVGDRAKMDKEMLVRLSIAACLLATGVCVMHYLGMYSQSGFFTTEYHAGVVMASAVVALLASGAGLFIIIAFKGRMLLRLLSACVISMAVNGMHYTGMVAVTYRVKYAGFVALRSQAAAIDGLQVAVVTLMVNLGLYVVANYYGESLRRAREMEIEAEKKAAMKQKVADAVDSVRELGHPMIVIPGWAFLQIGPREVEGMHEGYRATGRLTTLDTMRDVLQLKELGAMIVFFSYECLVHGKVGPNETQLKAMRASLAELAQLHGKTMEQLYVWLDCLSVPQKNKSLRKAAIDAIYTFASVPDIMVIVCPPSIHASTDRVANAESVKQRLWCRVEHLAHCCSRGTATMHLHRGEQLEPLPEGWMEGVCAVHESESTCCRLRHATGQCCDREVVVFPLLALYFDMYSRHAAAEKGAAKDDYAWDLIQRHRARMFPKTFNYRTSDGEEERELFGPMIERIEEMVDRAHGKGTVAVKQEVKCGPVRPE